MVARVSGAGQPACEDGACGDAAPTDRGVAQTCTGLTHARVNPIRHAFAVRAQPTDARWSSRHVFARQLDVSTTIA